MKTLSPTLVAYALKVGATERERKQLADATFLGLKIGAILFLVLLAIGLLTH